MTRYDPFAYGEVRLDPDKQKPPEEADADDVLFADGGQVKQAPPADASWSLMSEDVDDLLPGAAPAAGAEADADRFGADVLGESAPGAIDYGGDGFAPSNPYASEAVLGADALSESPPPEQQMPEQQMPEQQMPSAGPPDEAAAIDPSAGAPEPEHASVPAATAPTLEPMPHESPRARREVLRKPIESRAPAAARLPPAPPPARMRRRSPMLAGALPLALCAVGGTTASWFWVMQDNPVMAGILGASTLVAALFSWLLLRG